MVANLLGKFELELLTSLGLALFCGIIIGGERELRHKPAGLSTHSLVIGAATIFATMARTMGNGSAYAIAAQIVSGVGFLGAGVILKSERSGGITNLTTAASLWFSAAVGMMLGFGYPIAGILATVYAVVSSRIPKINKRDDKDD